MIIEKKKVLTANGEVIVLQFEGLVNLGWSNKFLVEILEELTGQDVVLDFNRIDFVDSTGVGEMLGFCIQYAKKSNFTLLHPPKRVRHLLHITRSLNLFKIVQNQNEALKSFPSSPQS